MTDSLAQRVRDNIVCAVHRQRDCSPLLNGCSRVIHAHAALTELVGQFEEVKQRLAQAERYEKEEQELAARLREERDEALELARVSEGEAAALRALCAKATFRADQAERERDGFCSQLDSLRSRMERENAALREALQRFAETKDDEAQPWIRKFARAALASSGSAPQKTTKPPCGG